MTSEKRVVQRSRLLQENLILPPYSLLCGNLGCIPVQRMIAIDSIEASFSIRTSFPLIQSMMTTEQRRALEYSPNDISLHYFSISIVLVDILKENIMVL